MLSSHVNKFEMLLVSKSQKIYIISDPISDSDSRDVLCLSAGSIQEPPGGERF